MKNYLVSNPLRQLRNSWFDYRNPTPKTYKDRTKVYTDKFGNNWYKVNPASIMGERALYGQVFANDMQFNLTKDMLESMLGRINDCYNKQQHADVPKIVGVIEAAMELYCHPAVLMNLSTVYYLLNDEDPNVLKDHIQKQKYDIWDTDSECKGFFLQQCYNTIRKSLALPKLSVPDYLKEVKPVLDLISQKTQ